jgi:hypothetical protein
LHWARHGQQLTPLLKGDHLLTRPSQLSIGRDLLQQLLPLHARRLHQLWRLLPHDLLLLLLLLQQLLRLLHLLLCQHQREHVCTGQVAPSG